MTDSICTICVTVIATSVWEAELERAESEHICNPLRIDYLHQLEPIPK